MSNTPVSLLLSYASTLPFWNTFKQGVFFRAVFDSELIAPTIKDRVTFYQTDFPEYEHLCSHGLKTVTEIPQAYDLALFLGGKFKDENLFIFETALKTLSIGGTLLCCMPNDLGAARFEKELGSIAGTEPFSYSKSKCRVFGVTKTKEPISKNNAGSSKNKTELKTTHGIFSAQKPDRGSVILVQTIHDPLKGHGADLGAGYGYLSRELFELHPGITKMNLFEAEKTALDCAETNLAQWRSKCELQWCDVTKGVGQNIFDWIVCNPPFHAGKDIEPGLGEKFLLAGLKALKPGGVMYVVQNSHLPYRKYLTPLGTMTTLREDGGYIVWSIRK